MLDKQKSSTQSFGTIEETTMKMSGGNKYPIFELHHNNITAEINIVCLPNSDRTNFKIDKQNKFPPSGSNQYVSTKVAIKYCHLFNDYAFKYISKLYVIMFIVFLFDITVWM